MIELKTSEKECKTKILEEISSKNSNIKANKTRGSLESKKCLFFVELYSHAALLDLLLSTLSACHTIAHNDNNKSNTISILLVILLLVHNNNKKSNTPKKKTVHWC